MTIFELAQAPARRGVLRTPALSLLVRLDRLAAALSARMALRRAERTLNGMSDHMLKDIGVSRAGIHRRIRGLD